MNTTRRTTVASNARLAQSFLARTRGLMFESALGEGQGLVIDPCSSIHMFWMRFPIDVLYVDKDNTIVRVQRHLRPWRIGPMHTRRARFVVELPVGSIDRSSTEVGDVLELVPHENFTNASTP